MSTLYASANCNAESINFVARHVPQFAGTSVPVEKLGFFLIRGTLVPYGFLDTLTSELSSSRLNCHEVTRASDLFEDDFLKSRTAAELDVIGDCVLLLVEQGSVPFSLVNAKEATQ